MMPDDHVTCSGSYPVNEHAQTQSNDFDWGDFEEPCADLVSHREGN